MLSLSAVSKVAHPLTTLNQNNTLNRKTVEVPDGFFNLISTPEEFCCKRLKEETVQTIRANFAVASGYQTRHLRNVRLKRYSNYVLRQRRTPTSFLVYLRRVNGLAYAEQRPTNNLYINNLSLVYKSRL